jgi:hypothetical protein
VAGPAAAVPVEVSGFKLPLPTLVVTATVFPLLPMLVLLLRQLDAAAIGKVDVMV